MAGWTDVRDHNPPHFNLASTNRVQKITPPLWFDSNAEEAFALYTSAFQNSEITSVSRCGETDAEV